MDLVSVPCNEFYEKAYEKYMLRKQKWEESNRVGKRKCKVKDLLDEVINSENAVTRFDDALKYYATIDSAYNSIYNSIIKNSLDEVLAVGKIKNDLYIVNMKLYRQYLKTWKGAESDGSIDIS